MLLSDVAEDYVVLQRSNRSAAAKTPIRNQRFLKQILIRGDNVVMISCTK
jgi:small nuclear ribonucleoprotein (snRNP)-like protein